MQRLPSREGNYAVIVGVTLTAMLGFAALAVDVAYLRLASMQAQNAADAGAHAALVQLRLNGDVDDARMVAEEIVNQNYLLGQSAQVDPNADITFGGWDYDDRSFDEGAEYINAVRVDVRKTHDSPNGPVELMIMKVFGTEYSEAEATNQATGALRYREIFIVQDVTGSFEDEMPDAVTADNVFLDYLYDKKFPGDRIGMTTFVREAEIWTQLKYIEDEYDDLADQWSTLDWCDRSYWNYEDYPEYYHVAPQMMGCNTGSDPATWWYDSGTSQGSGLEAALDILTDESQTDSYALKTIVLVSDGKPQCVPSETACDNALATYGLEMADWAEENDVSIFSVSFNYPFNETQSAYMESLVRGYGKFYETLESEDLPEILEEIASAIPIALVE